MMSTCPCCERESNSFAEFPKAFIISLERLPLPDPIEGWRQDQNVIHMDTLPSAVAVQFAVPNTHTIIDKGIIYSKSFKRTEIVKSLIGYIAKSFHVASRTREVKYYHSAYDCTDFARKLASLPVIQDTLETLKEYVGAEVATRGILALPAFHGKGEGLSTTIMNNAPEISLTLYEQHTQQRHVSIDLCGWMHVCGSDKRHPGYSTSFHVPLAEMVYEGRFNTVFASAPAAV